MKQQLTIIASLIVSLTVSVFAFTPRQAFVKAPRDIFPTIDSLTRLDMLDYYEAGAVSASRNALGGEIRISDMTDNSLKVETSGVSTVDILLLPGNRDTLITVINTMKLPVPDASISMYNASWGPVSTKKIPASFNNLELWLNKGVTREQISLIENLVPFIPVTMSLEGMNLTVRQSLKELLNEEDYKQAAPYIKDRIIYSWNGKSWIPNK